MLYAMIEVDMFEIVGDKTTVKCQSWISGFVDRFSEKFFGPVVFRIKINLLRNLVKELEMTFDNLLRLVCSSE